MELDSEVEPIPSDPRHTLAISPLQQAINPWQRLAEVTLRVQDATSRSSLLEAAVDCARLFFQARGAMLALGRNADSLSATASVGLRLQGDETGRCLELAERIAVSRTAQFCERQLVGVPIRDRQGIAGALVLFDLAHTPAAGSQELAAFQALADVVGRTLVNSLLLEEGPPPRA